MAQSAESVLLQRRKGFDRRTRPTSFWSVLRFNGKRRGFRRTNEAYNQFVDCPSSSVVALALWVTFASALDALLTLIHLSNGGGEANPFMDLMITHGNQTFVIVKMCLTCTGAWALSALQLFPLANRLLHGLAFMYVALLGLHMLIWLAS
jgi:hypothetical protein